jgi:hypothetical protein
MQQVVRQRHQVLLLMHATPAANQQELQLRNSFQITGYSASNTYTFTPSVVSISGTGLVTANSGT